jgi:hypothetical protein
VAWDATHPFKGLGFRVVETYGTKLELEEHLLKA